MSLEQELHKDFRIFLTAIWTHLNLPVPTRAQLCIAEYLQHGPKDYKSKRFEVLVSLGLLLHLYFGLYSMIQMKKLWSSLLLKIEQTHSVYSVKD